MIGKRDLRPPVGDCRLARFLDRCCAINRARCMDVVIEHNLSCPPPQILRAYYTVATSLVRAESERILAAIGLLGGTFDPVHIGHLIMAESACDALALERIEFIPTHIPPHKADELITPEYDRVAMLRAAIDG